MMGRKNRVLKGLLVLLFLCAVFTHFTVQVYANQKELPETRATALAALDGAFEKLSANAEAYQGYIDMVANYLPEDGAATLNALLSVAQFDISTEEKIDTLIEISQSGCSLFILIWLIAFLLSWILGLLVLPVPIPALIFSFISLVSDIGLWGLILCLLGIL